jgi:hypothetical protein
MKKILLFVTVFLLAAQFSFAQTTQWLTITYNYFSGPVSPEYQKTYSVTVNQDRSASISYHQGIDKMAPQVESFTISKSNHKKITSLVKKLGILNGEKPTDTPDGMVGGPSKSITITYGPTDPNLDQPSRQVTFNLTRNSSEDVTKLFDLMDKVVTKKIWKKLEKKAPKTDK